MIKRISRSCRRDSPDRKWFMQMMFHEERDGTLFMLHRLVREEAVKPPVPMPFVDVGGERPTRRGGVCHRIIAKVGWRELEDALPLLGWRDGGARSELPATHGLCHDGERLLPRLCQYDSAGFILDWRCRERGCRLDAFPVPAPESRFVALPY